MAYGEYETEYEYPFDYDVRYRVGHTIKRDRVKKFRVQLEVDDGTGWKEVIRYDTEHGRPHKDIYRRDGTRQKEWLDMSFEDALTFAETDLKTNWRRYRDIFLGRG